MSIKPPTCHQWMASDDDTDNDDDDEIDCLHELLYINLLTEMIFCFKRPHVKDIFQSIAAKANGEPCCEWVSELNSLS